ncbi:hypothetical protein RN10_2834 [Mycobacterium tuberculosis]|nr:hypothetical protein RN10_2834 [Mycobacterium tuberculosis]
MIRELVTTAAITGAAIGGAPVAGADPQRYDGDVPGMNYDASLGAPCSSWERFIFGRGPPVRPKPVIFRLLTSSRRPKPATG